MLAAPYKADLSFLGRQDFQSGSLAHVIIGSLFSCYIQPTRHSKAPFLFVVVH